MDNKESINDALDDMKEKIHQGAMFIVGNSKDITSLEEWQVRQDESVKEIKKCLKKIEEQINSLQAEDIASLRVEVAKGRPSWAVTIIITFLSSVTVGAIVFALRVVGGI